MRLKLSLAAISILVGCASSPQSSYIPTKHQLSFPPIGEIIQVELGEEMMVQGFRTSWDGVELKEKVSVGLTGAYSFTAGEYREIGKSKQGTFYEPTTGRRAGRVIVDFRDNAASGPGGRRGNHARGVCNGWQTPWRYNWRRPFGSPDWRVGFLRCSGKGRA